MFNKLLDKLFNPDHRIMAGPATAVEWQPEPIQVPKPVKPTVPRMYEFTGDTLDFLTNDLEGLEREIAILTEKRRQTIVAIDAMTSAFSILGKDESVIKDQLATAMEADAASIS